MPKKLPKMRKLSAAVICGRQLSYYFPLPAHNAQQQSQINSTPVLLTTVTKHIYSLSIVQSYRGQAGYVHQLAVCKICPTIPSLRYGIASATTPNLKMHYLQLLMLPKSILPIFDRI